MNGNRDSKSDRQLALAAIGLTLALLAMAPGALAQNNAPNQDASTNGGTTVTLEVPTSGACSDGYGRNRASELSCSAIPELMPGYGFSAAGGTEVALSAAYWAADTLLTLLEEDDDKPLGTVASWHRRGLDRLKTILEKESVS